MIYYVDEIMGSGKTTAAIQAIKTAPPEQKFMFVTPYLSEVVRVKEECGFCEPEGDADCKTADLKRLLDAQANIVTTHALFTIMPLEFLEKIKVAGYVLFLDETLEPIEPLTGIDPMDSAYVAERLVSISDNSKVLWTGPRNYRGVFKYLKNMCDENLLRGIVNEDGSVRFLKIMPPEYLTAFKDVIIMTYLFKGQILNNYLEIEGLSCKRLWLKHSEHTFSKIKQPSSFEDYRPLVTIIDNERMNQIGKQKTALSHSWYARNNTKPLTNGLNNFFRNMMKSPANSRLWTSFVDNKEQVGGTRYAKSFLACNTRATNEYGDRTVLAYLVNRYRNPFYIQYFRHYGIETNNDMFALSEMLQWLWRSALRNGKSVTLYIPSSRMRGLLVQWLDFVAGDFPQYATVEDMINGKEQMFDFEEDEFYE